MIFPSDLRRYLRSLPFLGRASLSTHSVTAGEWVELRLTYEVGSAGFADGGWLKVAFKFYSDWGLFQTSDPRAANYVSAEFQPRASFPEEEDATVRALKVRFDQKGHERPYQKAVIVDIVDGYLRPGDRIVLRLGDRRQGSPGTRAQTFVEDAFRFRVFVDIVGASRFAPLPDDLMVAITPGLARRLTLLTPRLVRPNVPFTVTVRADDVWGNLAEANRPPGVLRIETSLGEEAIPPVTLKWDGAPLAWSRTDLALKAPGRYRLQIEDAVAWLEVDPDFPAPRAYFADLHIHSDDTVGVNRTETVFAFARDAAALDIAGYTANDFNVRADRWSRAVDVVRGFHAEEKFLAFPGTEWCGASAVGGDRNVIFLGSEVRFPLDQAGRSMRVFDWNEDTPKGASLQGEVPTAADLHDAYRDLAEKDQVLLIPHVGGRRALFAWHDAELEKLVEIASSWGHFDWFYREALATGLKVGASAAGDEHRGRPGGGAPGVGSFGTTGGLTGVLATRLGSLEVARALRARHTWATTGQRAVLLLQAGSRQQGDEFTQQGPLEIAYKAYAAEGWERLELRDDEGHVLLCRNVDEELGYSAERIRIRWGGARIRDRYRWAEWRGAVKLSGATVKAWKAHGLEHPEEQIRAVSAQHFVIRTDTYGDADQLELEVTDLELATFEINLEIDAYNKTGDVLTRNPNLGAPGLTTSATGADLLARGNLRWDLGGTELFVAIERLTDAVLPVTLSGRVTVAPGNGPHGHRSIYLFGRERSDAKAWTSPLFVRFEP